MLPKVYNPQDVEDRIYKMWEKSGAFRANRESGKKPFVISMPPPNATGQLHLGHAVMLALEDIFIRFARMQGKEALWVPGTDHAAIATENVVIRKIQDEEGMEDPRATLGRETLLKRIADFVEESRGTIRSQIRKMGSSCDWSRECYTFDPALNRCVNEIFKAMYEDGLIYRGHRIVNWDPKLQTNVSDDEVERREEQTPLYTFQYGPFQISTARPETKFGDKYVVMHPDDERYRKYQHGDTFECEWINGKVSATIIKDEAVDPEFGTGVMTITPWHDATDFEIAERHNLDKEQIIDFEGKLLPIAGEFHGMGIEEARPKILEKLESKGLLVTVDDHYTHNVALNSRGEGVIEPQIKEQWFIDVHKKVVLWQERKMSLREVMRDVVQSGDITIIPDRFEKTYFHWIDHLRDWCISRQIWWGHRVPVWYCIGEGACKRECKEPIVAVEPPLKCPHCGSANIEQDPDTLDTWFSSALWTWSTLVDPKLTDDMSLSLEDILKRSPDYQCFHPTQVLETGYDILFFWVARMILMTTYATGRIPFETVYLHGMVRTRDGRKMSKSDPETCIDPLEIIPEFGADALRLSMIVGQSPGNDFRLYKEKIAGYRNFVNKLWNAARFVLMQCENASVDPHAVRDDAIAHHELTLADRALLSALQTLIADVTEGLEEYRLSEVGERLYSFVWDYFCDWYLELSKGQANPTVLVHALRTILKLLHPYCPFVTEELWFHCKPADAGMLLNQPWPEAENSLNSQEAFDHIQVVIDVVSAVRKIRADQNIEPSKKVPVILYTNDPHLELLRSQREHIQRLARIGDWTLSSKGEQPDKAASVFLKDIEIHVPLAGLMDVDKELKKLRRKQGELERFLEGLEERLGNKDFVSKAPQAVIEHDKEMLAETREQLQKVADRLESLGTS